MVPQNLRFGGGVAGTVLNPLVAAVLILLGVLICVLPQKKVIIPFLLAFILIPLDQILVVAGLHFPSLRIVILFGMIRIFVIKGRGQWKVFGGGLNGIDKALILLYIVSAVDGVLLFQTGRAITYQVGEVYTALGTYFVLRCLVRDYEDVVRAIRVLAFVVIVVGGVMAVEHHMNGWNPYALLGGARASSYASGMGRDGKIRAMGSFSQPILAGTFAAVTLPLFLGIWLTKKGHRLIATMGIVGASVMVVACNSSTPWFGLLGGLVGLFLWPIRSMTRIIRWGIVFVLVSLQIVMKAPVYNLITRFDISGSSYHRYELINQSVRHFGDWWLIGTANNADWGWDMFDTANQYVQTAINGGLLSLILFIALFVYGFKYLGRARRAARDKQQAFFFWALTSALLAYSVAFFGISLWDQSVVLWYALLAFVGAVAAPQFVRATAPNPGGLRRWERPPTSTFQQPTYPPLRPRENEFLISGRSVPPTTRR